MTEMEHTYEAPDPNDAFWHIVLMVLEERARAVTVQTIVEDRAETIQDHRGVIRRRRVSPAVRSEVRLLQAAHVHPIPPAAESRDRIRRLLSIVTAGPVLTMIATPPSQPDPSRPAPPPGPVPTVPDTRDGAEVRASLLELD